MTARQKAIQQMNDWGGKGKPFFFMIDFDMECPVVLPLEEVGLVGIRYSMPSKTEAFRPVETVQSDALEHDGYALSSYASQFQKVVESIRAGDSFLVNLTCETPVRLKLPFEELFDRVRAKYKLQYQDQFLVFSPETFVQIQDGVITSCPMKGTMDASIPNAMQLLMDNPKEKAEHSTIVDLIRNDLSIVATNVRVNRFRYVEEIAAGRGRLLQVSSEIAGQLPADYASNVGDILFALLPAGSITGAPKKRTVEIIRAAETYQRGFYTGIFGVFDGKDLDSAVMIRFLENKPTGTVYKSGGGITAQSDLMQEYEEMIQKIYVPLY